MGCGVRKKLLSIRFVLHPACFILPHSPLPTPHSPLPTLKGQTARGPCRRLRGDLTPAVVDLVATRQVHQLLGIKWLLLRRHDEVIHQDVIHDTRPPSSPGNQGN